MNLRPRPWTALLLGFGLCCASCSASHADHAASHADDAASHADDAASRESIGAVGSHIWFDSSVRVEVQFSWFVNGFVASPGVGPTRGGSCWLLERSTMTDAQRAALEAIVLIPITAGCSLDGYFFYQVTVVDRDGSEAVYRDTGCPDLAIAGATAMLPDISSSALHLDTAPACGAVAPSPEASTDASRPLARFPAQHRGTAAVCSDRTPDSWTYVPKDAGQEDASSTDAGVDPVCDEPLPNYGICSDIVWQDIRWCVYDECFKDDDCPPSAAGSHAVCACNGNCGRNACTYGNCRTDADCGLGGACSPSTTCYGPAAYFCHTADDECIDDGDCKADVYTGSVCAYAPLARSWTCQLRCVH